MSKCGKIEIVYKNRVLDDIKHGMTCDEIVKKYPEVSMYFARKWSGEIYHKADLSHYIRDRYKWVVCDACADIENEIISLIGDDFDISEEKWARTLFFIRKRIYQTVEEAIKKN